MSERPTPQQIIVRAIEKGGVGIGHHAWVLAELQRHGYVIVHPDDVPKDHHDAPVPGRSSIVIERCGYAQGRNDCRRRTFGGSHE